MDLKHSPSPLLRRLAGLGIAAAGAFLTSIAWHQALTENEFSLLGALAGPGFAILGIGLILFPGYREERLARGEDISRLQGMELLTPRWRGVLGVAFVAALLDFVLLKGWWRPG